jgi:nucleoside transporter
MSSDEKGILDGTPDSTQSRPYLFYGFLGLAYAYLIAALIVNFQAAVPVLIFYLVVHGLALINFLATKNKDKLNSFRENVLEKAGSEKGTKALYFVFFVGFLLVALLSSISNPGNLIGLAGLVFCVVFSYAFSWKRNHIKWRPVVWGIALQLIFAILILRWNPGFVAFNWLSTQITTFIGYSTAGSIFLFGKDLVNNTFAFFVLPTIIYFSGVVSVLYYYGILQVAVRGISSVMVWTLGTSPAESLNAAANIFVGQTEAPLLIRPYLKKMTASEIHAVMTGGFATIAGGVLAAFVSFGVSASHLLAASLMSAPAALAISKVLYPETEEYEKDISEAATEEQGATNVVEALTNGAIFAIQLAANIAAIVLTFLAIIKAIDGGLSYFFGLLGWPEASFATISGYVFWPVSFLMGVPAADCLKVGQLLGYKIFANEFVAYLEMVKLKAAGEISERGFMIATYALCGFSNFGSIGIQLGGLIPMAPNKKEVMIKIVFSAMVAGNLACFMTAAIAAVVTNQ